MRTPPKIEESDIALNKRLQKFRKEREVTQREMAEACGVTVGYLSALERGLHKCNAHILIQYGKVLKVPLDELAGNNNSLASQDYSYAMIDILHTLKHADRKQQEQYREIFNSLTNTTSDTREQFLEILYKMSTMDIEQLKNCTQAVTLVSNINRQQQDNFLQVITLLSELIAK